MLTLLQKLWEFLQSPTLEAVATVAGVLSLLYLVIKFLIKPLRVYYDSGRIQTLRKERLHLKHVQNYIDDLDRATYWEDLLYTPLEAETRPVQIIPPEFIVLKHQQPDQMSKLGVSDLKRDKHSRYRDILDVFNKFREPLIILGDPGAGKSVSFRHAVREMVRTQNKWTVVEPLIPIYVSCGHYTGTENGRPVPIETFVREYVGRTFSFFREPKIFDEYLLSGRLAFFFDALDEMPKADYSERISLLSDFAVKHSHNRIFFSCRKLDYDKRLNVREVSIRPFDRERRRLFLRKGLSQTFDRRTVSRLIYELETDSKLADLLSNPFFCQLVIFYVRTLQVIPSNRYQLFSKYIDRRLMAEQTRWADTSITSDQVVDCLSRLAYLMSESRGVGTSISYDDAVKLLETESSTSEVESVINASAQAKLLLRLPEHNSLQFSHHRLQEYFAARYATQHLSWERKVVKNFADDLWWREILIMMMGMEGDQSQKISLILDATFDDCRDLFDRIIEQCDQDIEQEHSPYQFTWDDDYALKKTYIWQFLAVFDAREDEGSLVQNLLQTERVIDTVQALTGRKRTGFKARIIERVLPALSIWAPPDVPYQECYEKTVTRFSQTLMAERDSLRSMRRTMVNRLSLAISCATNCNLHLGSAIWSRIREYALMVLKGGVPVEQVKIVKEIVTHDNDIDIQQQLRRLLTGDSRWVSRETFNTLLNYRIPHVGFDKRSILFLWRELNYYGSTGTIREYGAQLINSSIRLRSISIISGLIALYLLFLVISSGLMPWGTYQASQLEVMGFEYTINREFVIPLCWMPVVIALVLDFAGVKFVSLIGFMYGFFLSVAIWGFTGLLNIGRNGDPPPREVGLPGKIIIGFIGLCVGGYVLYQIVSFLYKSWIYFYQAFRFWLFTRRLKNTSSLAEGELSTQQLLEFYKKFESDQGKAMVIQLLEKYADYDEMLINALTDLAYHEKAKWLADRLWHLIYELEKRQLRAA